MALVMALGLAIVLTTGTETAVASNVRLDIEAGYAADAGLEFALAELGSTTDWNGILSGVARSGFADGSLTGTRTLADGQLLDLDAETGMLNCGRPACTEAQIQASTAARPWGVNNPHWQLFAYGPLAQLAGGSNPAPDSPMYLAVWIADDPMGQDRLPASDAAAGQPGEGIVLVRSAAFGPRRSRRAVEATVRRAGDALEGGLGGLRIVSWREVS
jgi:hypothetical protein